MSKPTTHKYASGKWDVRLPTGERLPEYIMGGNKRYFVITKDGQMGPCRTLKSAASMALQHNERMRLLSWERVVHIHVGD